MVDGAETELAILSLTHRKKFFNPNPTCINWMWNPNQTSQEYDERSWEVRAFAEDTSDSMGPNWPPRSYTCTFCRREFRSAQALGGHMNVHRRDRAKLHHTPPPPPPTTTPTVVIPTQESFDKRFHNNLGFTSKESLSTFLSMSPFPNGQTTTFSAINNGNRNYKDSSIGELDLELRLGQSSSQS